MRSIPMEMMDWLVSDALSGLEAGRPWPHYVFPNRRMGIYFQHRLAAGAGRSMWMPKVSTLNELLMDIPGPNPVPAPELILQLFACYSEMHPGAELDSFVPWAEVALRDIGELISHGIDPVRVFRNIAELRDIDSAFEVLDESQKAFLEKFFGSVRNPSGEETRQFVQLWNLLAPLTTALRHRLAQQGKALPADSLRERVQAMEGQDWHSATFYVAGFHQLNPLEQNAVHHLLRNPESRWITVWDETMEQENMETWPLVQRLKTIGAATQRIHCVTNHIQQRDRPVRIIRATGVSHAMQLAGSVLHEWMTENHAAKQEVAVIPASEVFLEQVLRNLPDSGTLPVNITMGYPLSSMQVWNATRHWMGLQRYEGRYPRKLLMAWLSLPIHAGTPGIPELRESLLASGLPFVSLSRIARATPALCEVCMQTEEQITLASDLPPIQRVVRWAAFLRTHLRSIPLFSEWETRAADHIQAAAEQIAGAPNAGSVSSWPVLRKLLHHLVSGIQIPFEGRPGVGLQVLGLLEARNLPVHRAIFLPVCEGVVPDMARPASFIPFTLRTAYGLALPQDREAIWAWHVYRLMACVPDLVLIVPTTLDGQQAEPSRFIRQLELEFPSSILKMEGGWEAPSRSPLPILLPQDQAVLPTLQAILTQKGISPSALSTLVRCPAQFAFERLLRLTVTERKEESVDARDFGNVIHQVMEKLYLPYLGSEVSQEILDAVKQRSQIKAITNECIRKEFALGGDADAITGKFRILMDVVPDMVATILEQDRRSTPFVVRNVESSPVTAFSRELPVRAWGKELRVRCLGKFDRVAEKEGRVVITDFKTGKCSLRFRSMQTLFTDPDEKYALQALMYAWLYRPYHSLEATEVRFYPVRDLMAGKQVEPLRMGVGKSLEIIHSIDDKLLQEFEGELIRFLESWLHDGYVYTQTEDLKRCEHCDYRHLCRR